MRYKDTLRLRMMVYYKNAFFKKIAIEWAFLEFLIQNHFRSFHFTKEWYNIKKQFFCKKKNNSFCLELSLPNCVAESRGKYIKMSNFQILWITNKKRPNWKRAFIKQKGCSFNCKYYNPTFLNQSSSLRNSKLHFSKSRWHE